MAEAQTNPAATLAEKSGPEVTSNGVPGAEVSAATPSRKSATKIKGLLYVVIGLAVAAAGIFFWLNQSGSAGNAKDNATSEFTLPLETFVVNLEGGGQRAYLRVGITLGLSHQPRQPRKEDTPIPLVRDAILSVLATAEPEALLTSRGKQTLKAELLKELQERAPDLGVENVYFTEFLVQM